MISAFSIKATSIHSCTANLAHFHKIRVKIVKSHFPFLLQLSNNGTSIVKESNIDTSGAIMEAHDIGLLDQRHNHPQLHTELGPFSQNSSKNREIALSIFATAL